jgi:histidine kinase 2/3/4 (cytokinin receptor)
VAEFLDLKVFSRPVICGFCSFSDDPKLPFSAIRTSLGIFVIILLVGHILFAAINRIKKVEEDCREIEELKGRAEAADVAKSQVLCFFNE